MTFADLDQLFLRMERLTGATRSLRGSGFEWQATLPDGSVHSYRIERMRSMDSIEDDVANLAIWIWNAKDYLKSRAVALGEPPAVVEQAVDASRDLCICADIANGLKHGGLSRPPRSGVRATLGKAKCRFTPQRIVIEAFKVTADPKDLDEVEVLLPILDETGAEIDQSLALFGRAVADWERVRAGLEASA